ncbi:porin [Burkholderia multivorans]|uniref:porin n=1 Tax=Burkholderia multivorans TaxID=87883 RepID=UPI0008414CE3|nr:porin [Burkholderia multivorans]AOJ95361.1 porin [Burkholderia multivorans]MBU9237693.1 porin [Burkholderia multivorans]MCO1345886.1 porin [Burkholderia multivorans]MCO1440920.1 porin [Burkholderia multivorans]MDN7596994.1 porin [Burkholderia multivorans]
MVKHAVAAAVVGMGAASGAWAQSSVVLYGSLDAGVAYVNNVGGHAKWAMIQGNTQPDRWGLKGKEDLGGGLSAIFQLENGFYTNNGQFATANTIWNRAAYVGLSSERLGTLTLGRQTPLMFDYLDPLSTAYLAMSWFAFHPGNIDGLAATGNVPYNNAIKYRSPSFAGFSAAATLALGNTTNFSTGKSVGVALNYANGPFKAAAVYSSEHDRSVLISQTGIASFQGQNTANGYLANKVENIGAGASYQFGDFLVHGLYTRTKMQSNGYSDTFQSYDAGVNYRSSPFNTIAGGAATTTLAGRRWTQVELGDIYALSKRTQLYANVLYEHASGGTHAAFFTAGVSSTANQLIVLAGIHHSF